MGLDMYLNKKTYVQNWGHTPETERFNITIKKGDEKYEDIKPERITYIEEEVGYWRKFNALHRWFVTNCQNGVDDCQEHYIGREQLETLLEQLLIIRNDHSKASDILPVTSGFFFGNTEYGEFYFDEIERTISVLEEVLKENKGDFYYQSSW